MYRGFLFDLDGVIVDTAKYHYQAWKELATRLGVSFSIEDNERLKGVSRQKSLEIIIELGGLSLSEAEKEDCCAQKNERYLQFLSQMREDEVLPGVRSFLKSAREAGLKIALGSASKNSIFILEKLHLVDSFDAIIDGNSVSKAKPDPEVFLAGARALGLAATECCVFEDAVAGIEAAHRAGMKAVGVGERERLAHAEIVIPGFVAVSPQEMITRLCEGQ